ncbi:protein kinase [Plantactinospora siamensis]|uniref:non-specific serine/threonine protein kinase n=1 Tax=Plantactinospora siamensis TaxID=555372 RepID=A0ABV6P2K0_9ACTN
MLGSGSILSGRYRLDDRVATGGMGDVWQATDLVLGRQVAVKVLLPSLLSDPSFISRFRAEARMMAALRHPGIVQVFDSGVDESTAGGRADFLVMEYVDGEPLSRRIDEAGTLSVAETLSIVEQAARALHGAHAAGIVHRDVKPSNLLVQPDGTVVLVDFGVARSTSVTSVTSTNAVPGTALYMAPEQASGKPVSPATDVYALGAVAFCCLTGQPPFTGENPLEVAIKHLTDAPPPLPEDIPAPVAALIDRALAKAPDDRFPDAAALAAAARAAGRGEFAPAPAGAAAAAGTTMALRPAGGVAAATAPGAPVRSQLPPAAVGAGAARPGRSRRRTLLGAAAAVALGVIGLTAALAFAPGDKDGGVGGGGGPAGGDTASSAPANQPGDLVSDPSEPVGGSITRTGPSHLPSTRVSTEPSSRPSSGPTAKPTGGTATTKPTPPAATGGPATSSPSPDGGGPATPTAAATDGPSPGAS